MKANYYKKHVFVCTNRKSDGKTCCADGGAEAAFEYIKSCLVDKALHGQGKIRVSKSGCLGRCSAGPCVVVYPEGAWYSYHSQSDLEQFVKHLTDGEDIDSLAI